MASIKKHTRERALSSGRTRTTISWEVRFRDPATSRHLSKSFRTEGEAKRYRRNAEDAADNGRSLDTKSGRKPFDVWARQWFAGKRRWRASTRDRNRTNLETHLIARFGRTPMARLRHSDIQDWVASLEEKGLAPNTVKQIFLLVQACMTAAVKEGLISESPCNDIELRRAEHVEQRFLMPDEVELLATEMGPQYAPLVYVGCYLGLRWGELAGLKRSKIDLLRREVRVDQQLTDVNGHLSLTHPKTERGKRTVRLPSFLVDVLALHLETTPDSEYLFTTPRGAPLRKSNFRRVWGPAVRRAGLDGFRVHDMRHTCAALLIHKGVNPLALQRWLGHGDIQTTYRNYGHLFENSEDLIASALDDVRNVYEGGRARVISLTPTGT